MGSCNPQIPPPRGYATGQGDELKGIFVKDLRMTLCFCFFVTAQYSFELNT